MLIEEKSLPAIQKYMSSLFLRRMSWSKGEERWGGEVLQTLKRGESWGRRRIAKLQIWWGEAGWGELHSGEGWVFIGFCTLCTRYFILCFCTVWCLLCTVYCTVYFLLCVVYCLLLTGYWAISKNNSSSLNWPTGPIQSLICNICLSVCLSVCLQVCATFYVFFKRLCTPIYIGWKSNQPITKKFRREKLMRDIGLRFSYFGTLYLYCVLCSMFCVLNNVHCVLHTANLL